MMAIAAYTDAGSASLAGAQTMPYAASQPAAPPFDQIPADLNKNSVARRLFELDQF